MARFTPHGHTPDAMSVRAERPSASFPLTLDLRRAPDYEGASVPVAADPARPATAVSRTLPDAGAR